MSFHPVHLTQALQLTVGNTFKMKLRLADALKDAMTSLTVPTALRTLCTDDD